MTRITAVKFSLFCISTSVKVYLTDYTKNFNFFTGIFIICTSFLHYIIKENDTLKENSWVENILL